ncbi:uncharacterized protein LOC144762669 [Lissotriton helveticus]
MTSSVYLSRDKFPPELLSLPESLWAKGPNDVGCLAIPPYVVTVKENVSMPRIPQYRISSDGEKALLAIVDDFIQKDVVEETRGRNKSDRATPTKTLSREAATQTLTSSGDQEGLFGQTSGPCQADSGIELDLTHSQINNSQSNTHGWRRWFCCFPVSTGETMNISSTEPGPSSLSLESDTARKSMKREESPFSLVIEEMKTTRMVGQTPIRNQSKMHELKSTRKEKWWKKR